MDVESEVTVVEQTTLEDSEKIWYIKDFRHRYGPLSWKEIQFMYRKGRITPLAKVRQESWPKWVSIASIFLGKAQENMEITGIDITEKIRNEILSYRYKAIFYFGLLTYLFSMVFFLTHLFFGPVLLIGSFILEILGLYYHDKYIEKRMGVGVTVITLGFLIFLQSFLIFFIIVLFYF
jgi:hypothetical protein